MSVLTKRIACVHCGVSLDADLVRTITTSGTSQVYWKCLRCKRNANGPGKFIEHSKITKYGIKIENIPVEKDYRTERCAVCGALGAEYHHWAPRHLFGDDADKWPGAHLCNKHHTLWHRLVTPLMSQRGKK